MSTTCSTVLLRCMDFRLNGVILDWLEERDLSQIDVISVAGSAKDVISAQSGSRDFILRQIRISTDLHRARKLILMHHTDCGAYGGHAAFESIESERDFQIEEMRKAEARLREEFPELDIELWLIDLRDDGSAGILPVGDGHGERQ